MSFVDSVKDALEELRRNMSTTDTKRREFLRREAALGATLFGPAPAGVARSFFCLDETTWVWHESWTDDYGQTQHITTRYDIYPKTIIKSQNGQRMEITLAELENFAAAVRAYYPMVASQVYGVALQSAV